MADWAQTGSHVPLPPPPSGGGPRPLAAVVLAGPALGTLFRLVPGASIGRDPRCAIALPEPGVSREHARISLEGDQLVVVDLGSRNGVRIDGQPVESHPLRPGQRLEVGPVPLLVAVADTVHESFLVEQRLGVARRVTAGVAHDMSNLVTVVTSSLDCLERELETEGDSAPKWLAAIRDGCERMSVLAQRLRGAPARQRENIEVTRLCKELALTARTMNADVEVEPDCTAGLWTSGDEQALHRALLNLVTNALEAMTDGGTLRIRASAIDRDTLSIEVSDTGPGMDPEMRQHALEPYYSTKQHDEVGRGLGLTSAYEAIVAHGGTLRIDSEPGRGTTVHVHLPRVRPRRRSAPTHDA